MPTSYAQRAVKPQTVISHALFSNDLQKLYIIESYIKKHYDQDASIIADGGDFLYSVRWETAMMISACRRSVVLATCCVEDARFNCKVHF